MCPNALLWAGFLAEIRRKSRVHISIRMVGSQTHVQGSMNMHKGRWLNENWSSIIGPHTKELWVQFSQGQVPGLAGSISALIGARVGGNQSICLSHINASLSLSFSLSSLSPPSITSSKNQWEKAYVYKYNWSSKPELTMRTKVSSGQGYIIAWGFSACTRHEMAFESVLFPS